MFENTIKVSHFRHFFFSTFLSKTKKLKAHLDQKVKIKIRDIFDDFPTQLSRKKTNCRSGCVTFSYCAFVLVSFASMVEV